MVVVPLVPERRVPLGPWTATGTLFSATFSSTKLPAVAGDDELLQAVRMPVATLVKELSMRVTEPVVMAPLLVAVMSIPVLQLLMVMPT